MRNTAQKVAKKSPAAIPAQPYKPRTHSPSYLYLKGSVYYFRHVFNGEFKAKFQRRELRITLNTPYLRTAKRIAGKLRVYLEDLLMDDTAKTFPEVRAELAQKLQSLLNSCEKKTPVTIAAIRERLDKVRQEMLDNADNHFYQPPSGVLLDGTQPVTTTPAKNLENQYRVFLKNMVNRPSHLSLENYPEVILEFLQKNIFSLEELTEETIKLVINEYIKMQISFNKIMQSRENGDFAYERNFYTKQKITEEYTYHQDKKNSILLTELIEKYISTKINDKHWKEHSVPDHRNRINFLLDILGDKNIEDISRDEMRSFRDILSKLPPNRKKSIKYRNMSIEEILKITPDKVMNIKTVNIIVEAAASMFSWAIQEGYLVNNPAKSLQLKDDRQEIGLKESFTSDDIKKIFNSTYTKKTFKNPAYYWALLIALYTGMRLEEICQLHSTDIMNENNIWYFDVNIKPSLDGNISKKVKTKNAIRPVPIHDNLIKLGFIDYVKGVQNSGHERIFYKLNITEKSPKYGKQVTKTFSRYLEKIGISGKKSFHSLRHTFSDYFKKRNMHNDVFRQVFGHEISELAGKQYGSKFSVEQCYRELISLIDYDQL